MPGIVIDIGGDDDGSIGKKARKATETLSNIGKAMEKLAGGGLRGGLGSALAAYGMAGSGVGVLALGAASLATTLGVGVKKAIDSAVASQVSRYAAGAMGNQMGLMEGYGSFLGGGSGQMAGMANSLADKLREGGLAAGWARGQGLVDLGPYTLNKVDNLTRAIEKLRGVEDRQYRMYLTRELLGAEAAPLVELSEDLYRFNKWASEQATLTPNQQATLGGVKSVGSQMWNWTVTGVQQLIADAFSSDLNWLNFGSPISQIVHGVKRTREYFAGDDKKDDHTDAVKQNTQAIKDLTRAARTESIHEGPRSRRAIPKAWKEMVAEDAMREQVRRLGGI